MPKSQSHTKTPDYPLAGSIINTANRIWLVGRGVYARAEDEGSRVFDQLVSVGGVLEKKAREQVSRPVRDAERRWSNARTSAGDAWSHLEIAVERRVAKTLNSLQIPTHRDVAELSRRVEGLQRAVDRLNRKSPARRTAAAATRKTTGQNGTARVVSRRSTAAKKTPSQPARTTKPASRTNNGS